MAGALPPEVQQFIARYIDSVEKLEIIILFAASPERLWTVDEVFQKIQSSNNSIARRLRELQNEGFIDMEPDGQRYRFKPATPNIASGTAAVASAYRDRRIKVIEAIFSRSEEQIRKFSDAFRLRKDEE